MTRPRPTPPVRAILVPVDGSASSRRAVELAAQMAAAFGATLTLLHVAPVPELPALIAESEEVRATEQAQILLAEQVKAARQLGVDPTVELLRGHPSTQIVRSAATHHPDLIVMGTRGLTGAKSLLLGSVSRTVSRRAKTQVVLVR